MEKRILATVLMSGFMVAELGIVSRAEGDLPFSAGWYSTGWYANESVEKRARAIVDDVQYRPWVLRSDHPEYLIALKVSELATVGRLVKKENNALKEVGNSEWNLRTGSCRSGIAGCTEQERKADLEAAKREYENAKLELKTAKEAAVGPVQRCLEEECVKVGIEKGESELVKAYETYRKHLAIGRQVGHLIDEQEQRDSEANARKDKTRLLEGEEGVRKLKENTRIVFRDGLLKKVERTLNRDILKRERKFMEDPPNWWD